MKLNIILIRKFKRVGCKRMEGKLMKIGLVGKYDVRSIIIVNWDEGSYNGIFF